MREVIEIGIGANNKHVSSNMGRKGTQEFHCEPGDHFLKTIEHSAWT